MLIDVIFEGVSPIMFNFRALPPEALVNPGSKAGPIHGLDNPEGPYAVAERKMHVNSENVPCVPAEMVLGCLSESGRFFKNGRKQITTDKMSQLPGAVTILTPMIPIEHKQPWFPDSRWAINNKTGDQILNIRPCFPDWKLAFQMYLDEELLPAKLVYDIAVRAGKTIGLGSFRPARKGTFGKFIVAKWEVTQEKGGLDVVRQMMADAVTGALEQTRPVEKEEPAKKGGKSKK
jgi:hypothetical protein